MAAENQYYAKMPITMLSDNQALPNNTSADSTNMAFVGKDMNGKAWIDVNANTAISIADTKALHIEIQTYQTDTAASAVAPFATTADGAAPDNGVFHYYILHQTSSGGASAWEATELITQVGVPSDMMAKFATPHQYIQLVYTTTADESSETVDAKLYYKV